MIYSIQPNWYQEHIRPRAVRRAVVAFFVAASVFASGIFLDSIIVMAISIGAFLFGLSDVFGLTKARNIVESLKISVSTQGLSFIFGPNQTEVLYPWHQLKISRIRSEGGVVKSFVVQNKCRKWSHVSVMGYENINDLLVEIQERITNA